MNTVARQSVFHAHISVIIHVAAHNVIGDKIKISIIIHIYDGGYISGIIKSIGSPVRSCIIKIKKIFVKSKAKLVVSIVIPFVNSKTIITLVKKIGNTVAVIIFHDQVIIN